MQEFKLDNMNSTSTFEDRAKAYLDTHQEWILRELRVKSFNDVVRIISPDWLDDFVKIAMKQHYFRTYPGIVEATFADNLALELGKSIDTNELKMVDGNSSNRIAFRQSRKIGEWFISPDNYLLRMKLVGMDFPFVIFQELVAVGGHQDYRNEILISQLGLPYFVEFVQNVEKVVNRITVTVWGDRTERVKPMEWDDLTLAEDVKFMVKQDLANFLKRKSWYTGKGLPYRRGYLFHGPPGNGKTTAIRAMLTEARLPAYTMKSMFDDEAAYRFESMFAEAARVGSAFIILEDVDRLFASKDMDKDSARSAIPFSVFLNCLDGIAESDGTIIIATANKPEVLDPAILSRPGRFDRVVNFPNPTADLRNIYFNNLQLNLNFGDMQKVVKKTDNMSFAQLREVYILGTQIADCESREISVEDLVSACEKIAYYNKKAGARDAAGFGK